MSNTIELTYEILIDGKPVKKGKSKSFVNNFYNFLDYFMFNNPDTSADLVDISGSTYSGALSQFYIDSADANNGVVFGTGSGLTFNDYSLYNPVSLPLNSHTINRGTLTDGKYIEVVSEWRNNTGDLNLTEMALYMHMEGVSNIFMLIKDSISATVPNNNNVAGVYKIEIRL